MAKFSIYDIQIRGISACVPKNIVENADYDKISDEEIHKFIEATGVRRRRIASSEICTSDLCLASANKLLDDLKWERKTIDIIILVTQSADYTLPITSAILQDKLGLSKETIAIDVPLGCSGYVYGLSILSSMMSASKLKRGILLAGDTSSKSIPITDKSTYPLFGDAGSATALEYNMGSKLCFDLGTDGSGYKAIIIPHGGSRNQINSSSFVYQKYEEGIERNQCHLFLDGMDVFSFGITQAPKTVKSLFDHFNIQSESIDYFIFHQANLMMNKMIVKKLKIPEEKIPYSLENYGNTSSATIPLTIVSEIRNQISNSKLNLVLCGFGVGLSWGTVSVETDQIVCPELIEL